MTDRELLELAAKAAGRVIEGVSPTKGLLLSQADGVCAWWNPLTTDGDALRLAVSLELFDLDKLLVELDISERSAVYHLDPFAATRLAITRAAAEIGRTI